MIVTSVFCQNIYPKILNINGDTIVAITKQQSRDINKTYIKADYYQKLSDSLESKITLLEIVTSNDSIIIINQRDVIENLEVVISNKGQIISSLEIDLNSTNKELESKNKKLEMLKTIAIASIILNVVFILVK